MASNENTANIDLFIVLIENKYTFRSSKHPALPETSNCALIRRRFYYRSIITKHRLWRRLLHSSQINNLC